MLIDAFTANHHLISAICQCGKMMKIKSNSYTPFSPRNVWLAAMLTLLSNAYSTKHDGLGAALARLAHSVTNYDSRVDVIGWSWVLTVTCVTAVKPFAQRAGRHAITTERVCSSIVLCPSSFQSSRTPHLFFFFSDGHLVLDFPSSGTRRPSLTKRFLSL